MTDQTPTNKTAKYKKAQRRKNLILIFGVCTSMVAVSPFFTLPDTYLANEPIEIEKAPKIHENDTIEMIIPNKKMHHNFLASYLLQESGLDRKSLVNTDSKGIFSDFGGRFVIPLRQLFGFY